MRNAWQRSRHTLVALFFLLLPWQTRWIAGDTLVYGAPSEFGRISIYGFEVVLAALLVTALLGIDPTVWRPWWNVPRRRWMVVALAVMVALGFAACFWAPEPRVAVQGWIRLMLAVVLFGVLVIDEELSIDVVLAFVAIGLLVPSLLGWVQVAQQGVAASTVLGMAAQDPDVLGTAVIEWGQGRWLRAYGSFPHPNMFGGFLAFGLVVLACAVGRARLKTSDLLFWLAAAMMGGALVMSASRGAWLAAALGLGVFVVGHRWIGAGDVWKRARSPVLLGVVVAVIVAVALSPILRSRFDASNRLERRSVSERADQWDEWQSVMLQGAVPMLLGGGAGSYTFLLSAVRPLQAVWVYQPIHNVPALIIAELGTLGGIAALLFVVATDWDVHRRPRRCQAIMAMSLGTVVLVLALSDHYLWTQPSGLYLLATFFALNVRLDREELVTVS